jgi:predicted esterase
MQAHNFDAFQQDIQELYQNGEYAAALALVNGRADDFPDYRHLLYYWRITLSARLGDHEKALHLLREVLLTGFWYGEPLLRRNPALDTLQGMETFEELVTLNQALRQRDLEHAYPLLILRSEGRCQAGGAPCPLLIGLHANACLARDSLPFWQPAAQAGWLVAAPQSSQAMWKDAFMWDDRQAAGRQIREQYDSLLAGYAVAAGQVVLAGHGLGSELAIWLALAGEIPASGFIAIGPDGPLIGNPDEWEPSIAAATQRGLRGYVIIGAEDATISPENVRALVRRLERSGIACQLEVVPGAGRDFVPDYAESLLRGLAHLAG